MLEGSNSKRARPIQWFEKKSESNAWNPSEGLTQCLDAETGTC